MTTHEEHTMNPTDQQIQAAARTWHDAYATAAQTIASYEGGPYPLHAEHALAVLDLHQPMPGPNGATVCAHCLDLVGDHTPWPCQTATAYGVTQ